ncbi:hypothetical protein ElyMa_005688400 [Elysia marginata]|uniref:Uncharacterized protein n=1 Tax=Elysia marginata TaxID=1093978 RepID=A0AAV4FHF3_9GAST|nr:hypothetical protein ElyMa_005688400 [Elysia marginata]
MEAKAYNYDLLMSSEKERKDVCSKDDDYDDNDNDDDEEEEEEDDLQDGIFLLHRVPSTSAIHTTVGALSQYLVKPINEALPEMERVHAWGQVPSQAQGNRSACPTCLKKIQPAAVLSSSTSDVD